MRSGARNGRSVGSQAGAGRRRGGRHRHLHPYAEGLDIANLILFLVSPLNDYIVRQNIKIDGGFDMTRAMEL